MLKRYELLLTNVVDLINADCTVIYNPNPVIPILKIPTVIVLHFPLMLLEDTGI